MQSPGTSLTGPTTREASSPHSLTPLASATSRRPPPIDKEGPQGFLYEIHGDRTGSCRAFCGFACLFSAPTGSLGIIWDAFSGRTSISKVLAVTEQFWTIVVPWTISRAVQYHGLGYFSKRITGGKSIASVRHGCVRLHCFTLEVSSLSYPGQFPRSVPRRTVTVLRPDQKFWSRLARTPSC